MAVTHRADTQEVSDFLVNAVGSDPIVEAVNLQVDERIGVWIVVKPVTIQEEHHLYEAGANLIRRYPNTPIHFDVISPRHFPDDVDLVADVIPSSARMVPIQRAS